MTARTKRRAGPSRSKGSGHMDLEKRHFLPQENGGGSRLLTLEPPAPPEPWEAGSQAVHPGTVLGLSGVSARRGPDRGSQIQGAPSKPGSQRRPWSLAAVHLWLTALQAACGTSTGAHGGHRGLQPNGPEQAGQRLPSTWRPPRGTS